jgi:hypothetical protein
MGMLLLSLQQVARSSLILLYPFLSLLLPVVVVGRVEKQVRSPPQASGQ